MYTHEVAIIGVGALGSALLQRSNHSETIGLQRNAPDYFTQILECRTLFLCMKQGDILDWLDANSGSLNDDQVVLSFGAALNLTALQSHTRNKNLMIGRAMTNKGIAHSAQNIVWTTQSMLASSHHESIHLLFNRLGYSKYVGVGKDDLINKETHKACDMGRVAYLLAEYERVLTTTLGYSCEEASADILQSISSIQESLLHNENLDQIAERVASKGGITEASIAAMSGSIRDVLNSGMQAACAKMMEIESRFT